jgi:hypothetical protein
LYVTKFRKFKISNHSKSQKYGNQKLMFKSSFMNYDFPFTKCQRRYNGIVHIIMVHSNDTNEGAWEKTTLFLTIRVATRKKHSCHNGLKLFPAQFFVLFEQDFWALRAGKPLFLLLELKNPAQMARKIELEAISSYYGRNVFYIYVTTQNFKIHSLCQKFFSAPSGSELFEWSIKNR